MARVRRRAPLDLREEGGGDELRSRELNALKTIARSLNLATELGPMLRQVLPELLKALGFTTGWIFLAGPRGPSYRFAADHGLPPALTWEGKRPMCRGVCWCLGAYWNGELEQAANIMECKRLEDARRYAWGETRGISHHATVPLSSGDESFGLLNVAHPGKGRFSREELALLESVAYQIGSAIARIRLLEAQRDEARIDERNRLARDLHDSVSQALFSLNLLAKGAKKLVYERPEAAVQALEEIHALAQESLGEMRALIWQLRPEGLERGLLTALIQYGERLGLEVQASVGGNAPLPRTVEEALWRIGQEALNNVKRHAGVDRVEIALDADAEAAVLTVRDPGAGFVPGRLEEDAGEGRSFGLIGMGERAAALGGDVTIESAPGAGTCVRAVIPLAGFGPIERGRADE